jgi:anti-sigma B factor antagonist
MPEPEAGFRLTVSGGRAKGPQIVVQGELDNASGQQLTATYLEALSRAGTDSGQLAGAGDPPAQPGEITLDLTQVDFIDSAGLRALIGLERAAAQRGAVLTVLAPPDSVTEMLELAGMADRVNLVREGETPPRESDFLERVQLDLEADDHAPRRARAAVRETLGSVLADQALANVVLMTSELVTNGVVHTSSDAAGLGGLREVGGGQPGTLAVGLRLTRFADTIRVEVDDPGAGFDPAGKMTAAGQVPGPGEGGRGLFVVDRCATRWGIRRSETDRGPRFSVWFELETG